LLRPDFQILLFMFSHVFTFPPSAFILQPF
jgi:hypothetical protein